MNIQPLIEGKYFHIYNRGVNRENLFKEKNNYAQFLEKYKFYCAGIFDTLAYCLLKNHFHLLVRIKEKVEVPRHDGNGMFRLNASKQLGHLFNSYAQSVNRAFKRTGPLFESPFERKLVDSEHYITTMICYCHRNPVHHGFTKDPGEWNHSSYPAILANDNSIVNTEEVLRRFGGIKTFEEIHKAITTDVTEKYGIEKTS